MEKAKEEEEIRMKEHEEKDTDLMDQLKSTTCDFQGSDSIWQEILDFGSP